jgi:hypothetical protein
LVDSVRRRHAALALVGQPLKNTFEGLVVIAAKRHAHRVRAAVADP